MHIGGIGVEQDNTKGYKYIKTAADQSDPKAQYTLGALYYLGAGVTKDLNSLNGQWVYNQHLVSAGSIIAALPPVLMFFLMQKHFIAGLTLGAVK